MVPALVALDSDVELTTDILILLAIIVFTILAFVREWMNMR